MCISRSFLVFFLLLIFSAVAPAAESTPERCTLVVQNCIDPQYAKMTNIKAFDGDDSQHMFPASEHGEIGYGQIGEVFCNHPTCDTYIQTFKTGTIIGAPANVYDACRDISVKWDVIHDVPDWRYDLQDC